MRFGVLGSVEAWAADGRRVRVPEARIRALLAALLAARGEVVSTDRLLDGLWHGAPPASGVRSLRSKVSQLRRLLDEAEPGARDLLTTRPPGYRLAPASDADRFEELLKRAGTADLREKARLLREALGLWRGAEAFADFADADLVRSEARRLAEQRLTAIEELAETDLALGEPVGDLAGELAALVAAHPLRERLRAAHVRALYRAGRQGEALAGLADIRARLRDELGVDPGPELTGLHQAILRQDASLTPAERPRHNLPARLDELIGRSREVREVSDALASARLVTLTGPGGVGKTRLALDVAGAATFPDGVWLVELASARTAADAVEAVAAVLGVRDNAAAGARPPAARLAAAVADRRLLLLLDNCEHLVGLVAELAARLLRAAPGLRVLATSREPLGITGERLWPVPPLSAASAVRLFADRAAAASPGFTVDARNAAAVEAICRRLDGIPLALEMAATRIRAMDAPELARRLDDRFRLLTVGARDAPHRQRTLRAVLDWSWDLLTAGERAALCGLAVAADGCTLETAEALCATDGTLDLLQRLIDRSLVGHRDGRYRMLESISAYALERLAETADGPAVRDRHLAHFLDLAERAEPHLKGPEQHRWLARLDAEAANLRAALDHAVRRNSAEAALRLVNALGWYWFLRGRHAEARRSFDLALAAAPDGPAGLRATAREWRAGMALLLDGSPAGDVTGWFGALCRVGFGDPAVTLRLLDDAHAASRARGDRWGTGAALTVRAEVSLYQGDLSAAEADGSRALELFRAVGDRWGELRAASVLSDLAEITGDYATADRLRRTGLGLAEELELWNEASRLLTRLGRTALLTGELDRAEDFHVRARELARAHSDERATEFAEVGLALVARRQGRLDDAETYLLRWLDWCKRWEGASGVALILAELGFIAELRGDAEAARALHEEGLDHARSTGDPRAVALALEGLAGAHGIAGRPGEAARLLGRAAAERASVGRPLPPAERADVDRVAASVRRALGDTAFDQAFTRGMEAAPDDRPR